MPTDTTNRAVDVMVLGDDYPQLPTLPSCHFTHISSKELRDLASVPDGHDMVVILKAAVSQEEAARIHSLCQVKQLKCFNFLAASFDPDVFQRWLVSNQFFSDLHGKLGSAIRSGSGVETQQPSAPLPPQKETADAGSTKAPVAVKKGGRSKQKPRKQRKRKAAIVVQPKSVGQIVRENFTKASGNAEALIAIAANKRDDLKMANIRTMALAEMAKLRKASRNAAQPHVNGVVKAPAASPKTNDLPSSVGRPLVDRLEQANASMNWPLLQEAIGELHRLQLVVEAVRKEVCGK